MQMLFNIYICRWDDLESAIDSNLICSDGAVPVYVDTQTVCVLNDLRESCLFV